MNTDYHWGNLMGNNIVEEDILSPYKVRELLNADNDEIIKLCKQASINPKRDERGLTYFSYEEVRKLKKMRELSISKISSENFSDEKIKKMILALEEAKTENETLKVKISQISRENCYLKDRLFDFKPLGFGIYFKKPNKDYSI